jgi:hypothetical protein
MLMSEVVLVDRVLVGGRRGDPDHFKRDGDRLSLQKNAAHVLDGLDGKAGNLIERYQKFCVWAVSDAFSPQRTDAEKWPSNWIAHCVMAAFHSRDGIFQSRVMFRKPEG